jgi:hypothetical protein
MSSHEFRYLPFIILCFICIYLLLLALLVTLYPPTNRNYFAHLPQTCFETFTQGSYGSWSNVAIFLARLIFAIFFSVYFLTLLILNYGRGLWIYFTNWNILLLIVYYAGATVLSLISLIQSPSPPLFALETTSAIWMALYLVAAPSALFVTLVDLALLNPEPTYWNFSAHLVTSITILTEIALNSIPTIPRDLCFPLSWALLYSIFIWIMRVQGVAKKWPYDFLATPSASSFFWYTILYILVIVCYFLFYGLLRLKQRYLLRPKPTETITPDLP